MTVTLSPDQLAWIETRIASGEFPDMDEAVRHLLADAIAERQYFEQDDMAWAKPLVEETFAAIERGETTSLAEFEARLDAKFGTLTG